MPGGRPGRTAGGPPRSTAAVPVPPSPSPAPSAPSAAWAGCRWMTCPTARTPPHAGRTDAPAGCAADRQDPGPRLTAPQPERMDRLRQRRITLHRQRLGLRRYPRHARAPAGRACGVSTVRPPNRSHEHLLHLMQYRSLTGAVHLFQGCAIPPPGAICRGRREVNSPASAGQAQGSSSST
jgi:hypothetical protein